MSFGFGVGDFIAVSKLANDVRQRWNDAPGEYAAIRNEIRTLESLLRDLNDIDNSLFPAALKATLRDVVAQCSDALTAANSLVDTYSTPSTGRVRKSWKRLKADPDDVRHVRDQLVSMVAQLNAVQNNIEIELDREILEEVQDLKVRHNDERQQIIANWFSPPAFAQQQTTQLNFRQPGTAVWFLQDPVYQAWRAGSNATIFCPGIAGSGKSVIFATVVADLQTFFEQDSETVVTYFYCNYKRKSEQTLPLMLLALVRQLFQEKTSIPESVQTMYDKHVSRGSQPSLDELRSLMDILASTFTRVFVLIDALDECNNDDEYHTRQKILSYLISLQRNSDSSILNLMTTSRPGVVQDFDDCPQIEIKARSEDIILYLKANTASVVACVEGWPYLEDTIVREIADIVDGMFLLARLHLESLRDKTKPRAILEALENLPRGSHSIALDQAYDEALDRIKNQREGFRELARKTLTWMTLARRELTIGEVQEALAIQPGMCDIDRELDLDDKPTIVSVCAGLIAVDPESKKVSFAHYTAQVYLESNLERWSPDGKNYVASSCCTYLTMRSLYEYDMQRPMSLMTILQRYKFLRYVGENWGFHLGELNNLPHYFQSLLKDEDFQCLAGQLLYKVNSEIPTEHFLRTNFSNTSFLHVVTYFNDRKVLCFLLRGGHDININAVDNYCRSALHIAATYGCGDAASVLLAQNDICVNTKTVDKYTPLLQAATYGYVQIVTQLLAHQDINVNLRDRRGATPLMHATAMGHLGIVVQLLAQEDISINVQDGSGDTPLSQASRNGQNEIVTCLLAHKDIHLGINLQDNCGNTALLLAAANGHDGVVAQLLARQDINPSVNLQNIDGRTPLSLAAAQGHSNIVSWLLARKDAESSVNLQDAYDYTPLSQAACYGHRKIVAQLLAQGNINPNIQDPHGCTPLLLALQHENVETAAQLLTSEDINVNIQGTDGETALSQAAQKGYKEIFAQLLARQGIETIVDLQDKQGRTPLYYAATYGHMEIVAELLAHQDVIHSINHQDIFGNTPLYWAAINGYTDIVMQLLARSNASVNIQDKEGYTALTRAARHGHSGLVTELLAQRNIDVNILTIHNETALSHAARFGHTEVVAELLAHQGVKVNIRNGDGYTPLSLAISYGYEEIVNQLLARQDIVADDDETTRVRFIHQRREKE